MSRRVRAKRVAVRGPAQPVRRHRKGARTGQWESEEAEAEALAALAGPPRSVEDQQDADTLEMMSTIQDASDDLKPDAPPFYADQPPLQLEQMSDEPGEAAAHAMGAPDPSPAAVTPPSAPPTARGKRKAEEVEVFVPPGAPPELREYIQEERAAAQRVDPGPRTLAPKPQELPISDAQWDALDQAARGYIENQLRNVRRASGQSALGGALKDQRTRDQACLQVLRARMEEAKKIQAHERLLRELGYSLTSMRIYPAYPIRTLTPLQNKKAVDLAETVLITT